MQVVEFFGSMQKRAATLSKLHVRDASGGAAEVEVEAEPDTESRKELGIPTTCETDADADSTSRTPPPRRLPEPAKPFSPSPFREVKT